MIDRFLDMLSSQLVRIRGASMEPTLPDGSWVVVNRRAFRGSRRPERFDIVRLEHPSERGLWIVKRVVGLPGEEVRLEGGRLFVDGEVVAEDYLGDADTSGIHEWWPRDDEYVVLGDNREASTDSRRYGPVSEKLLRGRVGRRLR